MNNNNNNNKKIVDIIVDLSSFSIYSKRKKK